jgi:hypothetical protein
MDAHPHGLDRYRGGLGYTAVLEHDQLGAGCAVYDFDKVFWVSTFEIAGRLIGGVAAVAEGSDHAP